MITIHRPSTRFMLLDDEESSSKLTPFLSLGVHIVHWRAAPPSVVAAPAQRRAAFALTPCTGVRVRIGYLRCAGARCS